MQDDCQEDCCKMQELGCCHTSGSFETEPFRKTLLATDAHDSIQWEVGLGRHGEGANRCGELLMKCGQSDQSSWGAPHNQVLVYIDSNFKYLAT